MSKNLFIEKNVLVRTYKTFLKKPLKVFVVSDFTKARHNEFRINHLNTLIKLKLIEEVSAVYLFGNKFRVRKEIKGYKLLLK